MTSPAKRGSIRIYLIYFPYALLSIRANSQKLATNSSVEYVMLFGSISMDPSTVPGIFDDRVKFMVFFWPTSIVSYSLERRSFAD